MRYDSFLFFRRRDDRNGAIHPEKKLLEKKCWAKPRNFFSSPSAEPGYRPQNKITRKKIAGRSPSAEPGTNERTNERMEKITKWVSKSTKAPR